MKVQVQRVRRRYRRSMSGGWLGGGEDRSEWVEVELTDLLKWTVGDGWLEVHFPEGGGIECLFADTATHTGAERKFSYGARLKALLANQQAVQQ